MTDVGPKLLPRILQTSSRGSQDSPKTHKNTPTQAPANAEAPSTPHPTPRHNKDSKSHVKTLECESKLNYKTNRKESNNYFFHGRYIVSHPVLSYLALHCSVLSYRSEIVSRISFHAFQYMCTEILWRVLVTVLFSFCIRAANS